MLIRNTEIADLERIYRLNLINSITGIKPANLVGTISSDGITNLAIFSSVVHLGSDPAIIGMNVRPAGDVRRDTYENIIETGFYSINHVTPEIIERAHYTSAKFPRDVTEFDACRLTEEYLDGFIAPFVAESSVRIGLKFEEEIKIERNRTSLIIGSIQLISLPDQANEDGHLNLETSSAVGISGLNSYYTLTKTAQFPYARAEELPNFDQATDFLAR